MEVEKYSTQGDEKSEQEYQMRLATIEENTKDLDENYEQAVQTAVTHFQYKKYEAAFEQTFSIIESEGKLGGKGHELLLELMSRLGSDHELVIRSRGRLRRLKSMFNI